MQVFLIAVAVFLSLIQATVAFLAIYVLTLGLATFLPDRRKQRGGTAGITCLRSFAFLIPARDEERVIGNTIKSLQRQNYPADLIDICVVADNCTDRTAEIARDNGALVYEKTDQSQSWAKPRALQFLLERLEEELRIYDAYVVFDADNVADHRFCGELNRMFDQGFHAVQGHRKVSNPDENWISNLASISEMVMRTEVAGRDRLGLSAYLRGSAMGFTTELLERVGGIPQHVDEVSSLQAMCALHGYRIGWCPSAVVLDEQASSYQQLARQRWRWFWVITHTVAPLGRQLLGNILHSPTPQKIEQLVYLLRRQIPHSMLIAALVTLLGASSVLPRWLWPWWIWGGLLVGYLAYFQAVLFRNRAPLKTYVLLLLAPLFVLMYAWILVSLLLGKRGAPGKTEHRGAESSVEA